MVTAKILTVSFLAATLVGCGHEEDRFYSCALNGRHATVDIQEDTVTLSLRREEVVSDVPYAMGSVEVWAETAPRHEFEYEKSVANTYCQAGNVPQPANP